MRTLFAALLVCAAVLPAAQVPRPAPEYAFTLQSGQQEQLSKHKGKVVVLEFLLTTCPHCQTSSRILADLNRQLGPKGFQPLGVAINPEADVDAFTKQFGVNFPVGKASRESAMGFLQHSIMAPTFYVPQMVFIDRKGVIRAQYGGSDMFLTANEEANIRKLVESLLAEPGDAAPAKPAAKSRKKS